MKQFSLLVSLFFLVCACVTPSASTGNYGIQTAYQSYIPAKTAVLACRPWPGTSNFPKHPQSNASPEEQQSFCTAVDEAVLDAFKGQSFMRGYTPKAVDKSLRESHKTKLLDEFATHWRIEGNDANECTNIVSFYNEVIRNRPNWRRWLLDLSVGTKQSDAVLIPFLALARSEQVNDRGLLLAKRQIEVVLLLIDIPSGALIWAGHRHSSMSDHRLLENSDNVYPNFPTWESLVRELFISSLWREYPGKIFL